MVLRQLWGRIWRMARRHLRTQSRIKLAAFMSLVRFITINSSLFTSQKMEINLLCFHYFQTKSASFCISELKQTDNFIIYIIIIMREEHQIFTQTLSHPNQHILTNALNQQQLTASIITKNKSLCQQFPNKMHKQNEKIIICSKQNQCQFQYQHKQHQSNDDSEFSIDPELLQEETPISIQIQPEIQLQLKPQINQLISTNIQMNRYKEAYKKIQKQEEQKIRTEKLKKLSQQAKQVLKRKKYQKQIPKNKLSHFISDKQQKNLDSKIDNGLLKDQAEKNPQTQNLNKQNSVNPTQLANKRIKQFQLKQQKRKQLLKNQQLLKQKKIDTDKLQQINSKINENAAQILKQKQQEIQLIKKRKLDIKNKIIQLQKQSLKNCQKSKKNPLILKEGQQSQPILNDSQYSTFEARKQGRKANKKNQNKKHQQQKYTETKMVAQTSSRRSLKQKITKKIKTENKKYLKKILSQEKLNKNQTKSQNDNKKSEKKFYFWNIPIKKQDFSLIVHEKNIEQQKYLKKNNQNQPSFKQQAEEFLKNKQLIKYEQSRKKTRQEFLQQQIEKRKNQIIQEFNSFYHKIL